MKPRKFLIDENTARALADQLRRRKPELVVMMVGDPGAPQRGTLDPAILEWIEHHGFTLITRNRKSMPEHLREHLQQGRHVPGIITLRPNSSFAEVIDDLILIWEATQLEEYQDQILHIPL
jgi:methionine synthase I (cobalamin-dependent)